MEDIYEFPLKQSIGEEVVPVVVKGDSVNRGQLLAFQGKNTLGANLFFSMNEKLKCKNLGICPELQRWDYQCSILQTGRLEQ